MPNFTRRKGDKKSQTLFNNKTERNKVITLSKNKVEKKKFKNIFFEGI